MQETDISSHPSQIEILNQCALISIPILFYKKFQTNAWRTDISSHPSMIKIENQCAEDRHQSYPSQIEISNQCAGD